jgi:acyl carrier protein
MTKEDFLKLWFDEMDFYDEFTLDQIHEDQLLTDFSQWDSLSRATVYNFVEHELGKTLSHAELRACKTIADVMKLAL